MSNNTASNLAPEILLKLFKETSKETQFILQQVCKSWYYPARQLYFSNLHLQDHMNIPQITYCLESAGYLVKSLKIDLVLNEQEMVQIIRVCPDIIELKIFNHPKYVQWILESELLLEKLKRVSLFGSRFWTSKETNEYYYGILYKHKSHIERLDIMTACDPLFENYGGIMNYLSMFKNLKYLIMIDGSRNVLIYLNELLNICPQLESLKIDLGHPLFHPNNITPILRYPTMEKIDIFLSNFSIEYFEYMMNRFINLQEFHVRINQEKNDWENKREEYIQFIMNSYLTFIRRLKRSSLVIKMNFNSSLDDVFANLLSLNNNDIDLDLQIYCSRSQRTDIKLDYYKGKTSMLYYNLIRDFQTESTEISFAIESLFINHLITFGNNIKKLSINLSNIEVKTLDLGLILKHCSSKMIEIVLRSNIAYRNGFHLTINSSLNILFNYGSSKELLIMKLNGFTISPQVFSRISNEIINLQYLECINCRLILDSLTTQFNMSNLNLKSFTFDVKSFYLSKEQYTCFVITSAGKSKYYLLDLYLDSLEEILSPKDYIVVEFIFNSIEKLHFIIGRYSKKQHVQIFI